MAKFVKLTQKSGDHPLYVNIEFISIIRVVDGDTLVFHENGEYYDVCETPEQILQMIADETPPPVSAGEFPRMWRDGWTGSFDWQQAQEAMRRHSGMETLLDSLHKPTQKEPLDGPPDV